MKKISCPKCKNKWDKDEYVNYRIDSPGGDDGINTPRIFGHIKIQDLVFCPICFFNPKKEGEYPGSSEAKCDRVVLIEDNIKIKSIVVEDEFGRYLDMDINCFAKLKVSGFSDFEDDVDDHTSVWGGAGPDCKDMRLVAAKL